jgi:dipeptidyl aminopeptidase/acylaminoacyl peptidase
MRRLIFPLLLFSFLQGCGDKTDNESANAGGANPDSLSVANGQALSGWSVQVGAFSEKAAADNLRVTFIKYNLPSYLSSTLEGDHPGLHRVRIGPFSTEADADNFLPKVKDLGYPDAFVVAEQSADDTTAIDSLAATAGADTLNRKQLTFDGHASHPQWSPSGREIAFYDDAQNGIYTLGTGGGHISRIIESTKQRRILPVFAWSPSGRRMAFAAHEVNERWELVENLYIVNKNGSSLRKVVQQDRLAFKIKNLKWSPDEGHLAFEANYRIEDYDDDLVQDVFILALQESESDARNRTDLAKILEPTRGADVSWAGGWQNDRDFLFLSMQGNRRDNKRSYEIWGYDVEDRKRMLLNGDPFVNNCSQVELSSNHLYYATLAQLVMVDMESAATRTIVSPPRSNGDASEIMRFELARDGIVFLRNSNLSFASLDFPFNSTDIPGRVSTFSVSPTGSRICYAENGNLFTTKISQK